MSKVSYGKRIRYSKHPEDPKNMRRAVKPFLIDGDWYYLDLHLVSFQYNVRRIRDNHILASGGNTKNIAVLKIQAKKALVDLGTRFDEDLRTYQDEVIEENEELLKKLK